MNGSDRFEGDYLSAEYAAAYTQAPLDYTFDHSGTPSPPPPQSPGGGGDIYPPFQFPVLSSPPPFAHFPVPASILHPTLRTVYLGNLSRDTTVEDILNHVRHGAIESCKILEDKNCAFVTFLDPTAASMFHQEAVARRLQIHGNELKVGWGKPTSPPPPSLIMAIQNGATRVVFVGGVDADVTNESLREEFSRFGTVDTVRVLTEKRIAFIHMASISMAVKAVATLQAEDRWQGKRINFAKDRCLPGSLKGSYVPGMMGQLGMMGLPGVPMGMLNPPYGMPMPPYDTFYNGPPQNGHPPPGMFGPGGVPNRTIYLGGIHDGTTIKELCDHIRGGLVQNVKYLQDKGIAFVTFVNPDGAVNFYNRCVTEGIMIHGKRVKIGWGKSQPMPAYVATAINNGATRNVYLGNVDANELSESMIRQEFEPYGEVEMINVVPEKAIAFINYADITSAIAAVEAKRSDPAWAQYRINYGKDRCANPPKPIPIPGRNKAAIDGFAEAPAAAEAVDPFVAPERTPPAVNGRPRSPPLPGPRPVTLSSFLAPPLPRAGYQQHQRSHSHQIKGTGLLERDLGAIGTGRPSSAQAMADMDDGRIPFRAKHKYRRSTSGVAQE